VTALTSAPRAPETPRTRALARFGRRLRRTLAVLLLALLVAPFAAAKDILVVHSYHDGKDWGRAWQAGLEAELPDASFETVYLDTKRLRRAQFAKRAEMAWRTFRADDPDAVVLGDDNALDLLGQRIADATDEPVVFLGINGNPRRAFDGMKLPDNVSGILERPRMGLNMRLIQDILPDADKVLVLIDEGVSGRAARTQIENMAAAIPGIRVTTRMLGDFQRWKDEVRSARERGYDVLIPALYLRQRDASGEPVPGDEVLAWTHANTPVPTLGFWRFGVGEGRATAGVVMDGEQMGIAAGEMLGDILATGDIPPPRTYSGVRLVVSRSGLDRWDLPMPDPGRMEMEVVP